MIESIKEVLSKYQDDDINMDDLLDAIRIRVVTLLDEQPDLLFSYMYRLDIPEEDIKSIINNKGEIDMASGFANLILKRQLKRIQTRRDMKDVD